MIPAGWPRLLYKLNPLAPLIEGFHRLARARLRRPAFWGYACAMSATWLSPGSSIFRRIDGSLPISSDRVFRAESERERFAWRTPRTRPTSPANSCAKVAQALQPAPARDEFQALESHFFMRCATARLWGSLDAMAPANRRSSKSLSRITPPTRGEIDLHGQVRVAPRSRNGLSSGADGAGKHLSQRRRMPSRMTIRLAILSTSIVAFAETERFLDLPVKRYSSGMYVRLAFAVAAHLRPDILIVDEVLAVGDLSFQRKCLGKIGTESRTTAASPCSSSHASQISPCGPSARVRSCSTPARWSPTAKSSPCSRAISRSAPRSKPPPPICHRVSRRPGAGLIAIHTRNASGDPTAIFRLV